MKTIYFLQNSLDFITFLDYLKSIRVSLCTTSNQLLNLSELKFNSNRCYTYYMIDCADNHGAITNESGTTAENLIEFSTSYQVDSYWHLGMISPSVSSLNNNSIAFKTISNYIKKNYILSEDKMFYIGVGMYDDWLNYRVDFLSLFSYEKLVVDHNSFDFDHFRDYISNQGYIVKGSGLDIRKPSDESVADEYVIFSNECKLLTRISARKEYYTNNSQCIFLTKNRKNYSFIVDKRLLSAPFEPIFKLYNLIKNYLMVKI